MAQITLTSTEITPNTVKLHSGNITYNWKNNNFAKSYEHSYQSTEVQMNGWENPLFNVTFYIPADLTESSDYMTWDEWNTLARQKVTTDNQILLTISTGEKDASGVFTANAKSFSSFALDSTNTGVTSIPVIIKSYSVKFDAGDSINGYFWAINAQLQETR